MNILAQFEQNQPEQWYDKNYRVSIRHFPNGQTELSAYCVQSMQFKKRSDRWLAHDPVRLKPKADIVLTDEEILKKQEDSRRKSVARARQHLRWLVKSLQADHLVTLNYRENMQDISRLKRDWQAFVRLVVARYPNWQYVAVHEMQDRGALHLHIAVHGRQDIKYLRRCWYKVLGASPDATGADTPGQVDVSGPSKRFGGKGYTWKANNLAGYMGKYMHKQFAESEKGAKRYWASKSLQLPVPQKIWLGCTNFIDAVIATHDLARDCGITELTMWASEGWQSIWMTG